MHNNHQNKCTYAFNILINNIPYIKVATYLIKNIFWIRFAYGDKSEPSSKQMSCTHIKCTQPLIWNSDNVC